VARCLSEKLRVLNVSVNTQFRIFDSSVCWECPVWGGAGRAETSPLPPATRLDHFSFMSIRSRQGTLVAQSFGVTGVSQVSSTQKGPHLLRSRRAHYILQFARCPASRKSGKSRVPLFMFSNFFTSCLRGNESIRYSPTTECRRRARAGQVFESGRH